MLVDINFKPAYTLKHQLWYVKNLASLSNIPNCCLKYYIVLSLKNILRCCLIFAKKKVKNTETKFVKFV